MADKNKNVRNPTSELFRKLTRLFSGPITDYRKQNPRQLRRVQLDKYKFQSAGGLSFKKTDYNPFTGMQTNYMANQARGDRYVDFDQMEYTPEIASSLDIYADEMTTSTILNPLLNIDCHNEEIKSLLDTLYHNILNIDFNLFGWCRTMCKYGDYFLYLDIDEIKGIQNVIGLPPQEIERLEGEDKTNPNYVQFQWNSGGLTFENWQIAHFRILGNDKYAPYGTSVLEPARRIWRQLILLEDAMMAYRIVRSPERRVFKIDVGNIAVEDVEQYMQKVVTQMKRSQVIDPSTGRVDLRYNPMSIDEDYFIPVRGGQSSTIETLPGGTYTGDIDDVKYLRDKLFAALKVPQSYLSRAEGADEDKTTLAQKDIRFARTVQRLQRAVISELEKIGIIHLYTLGFRAHDLISFKLSLSNPSKLAELQELEHWRTKFDVASAATEGFFSKRWIGKKLFSLSDEEIVRNQREIFYDTKYTARLEAVANEASGPAEGGLGEMGDLAGDMGDLGGELGEEEGELGEPEEELGAEEEGMLLAEPGEEIAPAKRDRSKGKVYTPVKTDKRSMGARKKNYLSKTGKKQGGRKNIFSGDVDLASLAKDPLSKGIYEEKDSNYNDEEARIFETNHEIKLLIENMENKKPMEQEKDENETETQ